MLFGDKMHDLTIVVITYNHEKYILECLKGIFSQKTSYSVKVIIHDDCSQDNTLLYIEKFFKNNEIPNNFCYEILKEKINTFGTYDFFKERIVPLIDSKYVAFCEGDDYWINFEKIQIQLGFLESNNDFSLCFHPVMVKIEENYSKQSISKTLKNEFNYNDLKVSNFIPTCSVVLRWKLNNNNVCLDLPSFILPRDYYLFLYHLYPLGKAYMINLYMAVYRKHCDSLWFGCNYDYKWFKKCSLNHMDFYNEILNKFGINKIEEQRQFFFNALYSCIENNDLRLLISLKNKSPSLFNQYRH